MLEGLSGTIQISDLCKNYGIKSARHYYWKVELIYASSDIFGQKGRKADTDSRMAEQLSEIQRLKDVIAEITQENLLLKKKDWELRGEKMTDIFKEIRSARHISRTDCFLPSHKNTSNILNHKCLVLQAPGSWQLPG